MSSKKELAKTDSKTESEIVPSNSLLPRYYWCQTKAVMDQVNFDWTIEHLEYFAKGKIPETITSTEFERKFSLRFVIQQDPTNLVA